MSGVKLVTAGSGGINLQPASSIASDVTVNVPSVSTTLVGTDTTQTLTNKTIQGGTVISGTAVASTSGTSIDFTGIPSWVKRITVMFNGVSTNGTAHVMAQLGTSIGIETTGYASFASWVANTNQTSASTLGTGIHINAASATTSRNVLMTFCLIGTNIWISSHAGADTTGNVTVSGGGSKTLSGTLDRVRITTVNGTDTFDAGSINILYE